MLKELLNEMIRLEKISNDIDEAWSNNPENESLESRWDEAYKAEYEALEKVIDYIQNLIHEDRKTIKTMIMNNRQDIIRIAEIEQA